VYEEIDCAAGAGAGAHGRGGSEDRSAALGKMSVKLQREAEAKARDIYERCGVEFNINSPKQLGDCCSTNWLCRCR